MQPFPPCAQWIAGPDYDYGTEDAGYYGRHMNHIVKRTFELAERPSRAVVYVAVLGYACVFVNGRRASDCELLGEWTNYTKLVYYHAIDVTELAQHGVNELAIELGNGWYNPSPLTMFGKYNLRERLSEVGTPQVLVCLEADGEDVVVSDGSWRYVEGQLAFNNVYLGETIDLAWSDDESKPVVMRANTRTLEPAVVERCRRFEGIEPIDVRELSDGSLLVDFGRLVSGMVDMSFCSHAGDVVEIRYAEILDEDAMPSYESSQAGLVGCLVPEGFLIPGGPGAPERAIQCDRIVCKGGEESFTNKFSVHSCRYACITGLRRENLLHIALFPVHTDVQVTGTVDTGVPYFDELADACINTKLNNLHGLWEDCARERLGYGGDMVALAVSNLMAFDCEGLIRKTVRDFRNDQTASGGMPETAPFVGIGSNGTAYGEGPLLWQLAYPHLILRAYQFYGCYDLVETEWPYVKRLVDYLLSWDPDELASHCLGDHGSPGTAESFKTGTPDKELVGYCTIARFARAGVRFCEILGEDASAYQTALDELKDTICSRFAHEDGTFGDRTQTGLAFAADLGLGDEQRLGDLLAEKVRAEGNVLSTGIFGATIAYDLLHRSGHSDVVEAWLTREGTPSYHDMLASGSCALAEQFSPFLSSYNHAMFSSCLQWLYQALGGIRVADDAVGSDIVELRPYLSTLTDHVECTLKTRKGEVHVSWTRGEDGDVRVTHSSPEGVTVRTMA